MKNSFSNILIILCLAFTSASLSAGKFDFMTGFYRLKAQTSTRSGTITNLGYYRFMYRHQFFSKLEFAAGYSLMMSNIIGGDLGYGFDVGLIYYPLTHNSAFIWQEKNTVVRFEEVWKPYLATLFHQRQFQSVQASYAGFSVAIGTERNIYENFGAKMEFQYMFLSGPSQASASQITLLGGLYYYFR